MIDCACVFEVFFDVGNACDVVASQQISVDKELRAVTDRECRFFIFKEVFGKFSILRITAQYVRRKSARD